MDSLPETLPEVWFARIRTTLRPDRNLKYRFGLSGAGKFKLFIDEKEAIDLWTGHPPKTDSTSCFSAFTMERFADLDIQKDQAYSLEMHLVNEELEDLVGAAPAGGVRLGGFEIVDEDETIAQAVELARNVDVPIILTGLGGDYEYEGTDRKTLGLPERVDELIERVIEANPNAIRRPSTGTWMNYFINSTTGYYHRSRNINCHALGRQSQDRHPWLAGWPGDRPWYSGCIVRRRQPVWETPSDLPTPT